MNSQQCSEAQGIEAAAMMPCIENDAHMQIYGHQHVCVISIYRLHKDEKRIYNLSMLKPHVRVSRTGYF